MQKIIECVPNISDGRNPDVYNTVAQEAAGVDGVKLLDVDPGADTNRTVITFAGAPDAVAEAAFRVVRKAAALIDMRKHSGEHPRHGATDVCPFVPVSGTTMEECAGIARSVGKRIGEELGIPVYLYEHAASRPEWRNLANVRKGEYEALKDKLGKDEWQPDFGPNEWNEQAAKTGVVTVGARNFLVAYNINFNTRDPRVLRPIANDIREKGNVKKLDGKVVRDENGQAVYEPGIFRHCKAMAWYIEEYGCAQITMNLTNVDETPVHKVYDKVVELAQKRGLHVTGSELVGLIPLAALTDAGHYFLNRQKVCSGVSEAELVRTAVRTLGLEELAEFNAQESVIEYAIDEQARPLAAMTIRGFADELASSSPAPGGGSVAALAGSMAAGLAAMVPNLTVGKAGYNKKSIRRRMNRIATEAQAQKDEFLRAIDDDTAAFNKLMDCFGMPKGTKDEKKARGKAIKAAMIGVTDVPLATLKRCVHTLELCIEAAEHGNIHTVSDSGTGGAMALACAEGANYNVRINLLDFKDDDAYAQKAAEEAKAALASVHELHSKLQGVVDSQLAKLKESKS